MNTEKRSFQGRVILILPALVFFIIFVVYPFISSIYYSFTDWDGMNKPVFNGIDNYIRLFKDPGFMESVRNTFVFCITSMLVANPLALLLGLVLNRKMPGIGILRTVFYLPAVLSLMVVSVLWSLILNYDGVVNSVLKSAGMANIIRDWISDYNTSIWAMVIIIMWCGVGVGAVFYLAGLKSIPFEIYESASIDGAAGWTLFKHVTFPLLMPSITIVTFLNLVGSLKVFDLPYVMTNGGGGSTMTMAMKVYILAFKNGTFGYATAAGLVLFIFVSVVSFMQVTLTRKREVEH